MCLQAGEGYLLCRLIEATLFLFFIFDERKFLMEGLLKSFSVLRFITSALAEITDGKDKGTSVLE